MNQGCRRGTACPFSHDSNPQVNLLDNASESQSRNAPDTAQPQHQNDPLAGSKSTPGESPPRASASQSERISVQKPTPETQRDNPREFELNQLRRRFNPGERTDKHGELLTFAFSPTDPDFPAAICSSLACVMRVPISYRSGDDTEGHKKPTFMITNPDLDFALRGRIRARFDEICAQNPSVTLLRAMNLLDRSLTRIFLTDSSPPLEAPPSKKSPPPQRISAGEKREASQRRSREITQLKARFTSNPLFSASNNDSSFCVPISSPNHTSLPPILQKIEKVTLFVPISYPLEPCQIVLIGVQDEAARDIEAGFCRHCSENPRMSLIAHVNFFSVKMPSLAQPSTKPKLVDTQHATAKFSALSLEKESKDKPETTNMDVPSSPHARPSLSPEDNAKPHVHFVSRPPEWDTPNNLEADPDESNTDDMHSTSFSDEEEDEEEEEGVDTLIPDAPPPGRGVAFSFPSLELEGVELLLLKNLSLVVKCERCKDRLDIRGLNISDKSDSKPPRHSATCGKCGNTVSVGTFSLLEHESARSLVREFRSADVSLV